MKADLTSIGTIILFIGGLQFLIHGPAANTGQAVFRLSFMGLGVLLICVDQFRKRR